MFSSSSWRQNEGRFPPVYWTTSVR
uniref:Uncharacterized protein n=1 Tax=Anguilla anguilla TaxID=7936 RepID=A0A0E9TI17_ANGAN